MARVCLARAWSGQLWRGAASSSVARFRRRPAAAASLGGRHQDGLEEYQGGDAVRHPRGHLDGGRAPHRMPAEHDLPGRQLLDVGRHVLCENDQWYGGLGLLESPWPRRSSAIPGATSASRRATGRQTPRLKLAACRNTRGVAPRPSAVLVTWDARRTPAGVRTDGSCSIVMSSASTAPGVEAADRARSIDPAAPDRLPGDLPGGSRCRLPVAGDALTPARRPAVRRPRRRGARRSVARTPSRLPVAGLGRSLRRFRLQLRASPACRPGLLAARPARTSPAPSPGPSWPTGSRPRSQPDR